MRILFTKQQSLESSGGESILLFALAHTMREMGHEIYLMPVTERSTPPDLYPLEFVRDVPRFGLHHTFDSFSLSRAVADFVKQKPVDAVLSWQYETAYLQEFAPRRNFIHGMVAVAPFGLLKHKAQASFSRRIAYRFFHFRLLHKADVIFCPSQFAKDDLVKYIGIDSKKIMVAHLAADEIFQPSIEPRMGPLRTFIFTGSLEPLKGVFDVIEALAIIHQRGYRDWTLKISGWGDVSAVRQLAIQRGIASQIEFVGVLDRPVLSVELARADLAILPSHTETFGLSIAEAQACGLPVVSYRTGGISEVVQEGVTALLADLFNYTQLADAIIRLVNDPESARAMGGRGAHFIRENFSWKKTAVIILNNLEQIKKAKQRI
jgi:glycosyltransferase involved in cell wall biosynthesis